MVSCLEPEFLFKNNQKLINIHSKGHFINVTMTRQCCALLDHRICHHLQCMGFDSNHMYCFSPMILYTWKLVLYGTLYLKMIIIFLTAHPVLPQFLGPIWLLHFAPVFKNCTYQVYRKTLHISPESSVFLSIWQVLLPRMIELNRPFLKIYLFEVLLFLFLFKISFCFGAFHYSYKFLTILSIKPITKFSKFFPICTHIWVWKVGSTQNSTVAVVIYYLSGAHGEQ